MKVIAMFRERTINRQEAADKLQLSQRQISRMASAVRTVGPQALLHRGRGRKPKNSKPNGLKSKWLDWYRSKYQKFNFKHAFEMIGKIETVEPNERVSYTTFCRWCRQDGLGKLKKRRSAKAHVHRERASEEGALLQLDGSDHKWLEHAVEKDCLIAFIDDATSKIPSSEFHASETTWACIQGLRQVVETRGIPGAILTDRAGWSDRGDKRFYFSQFSRLCEELGIVLIVTSSPQTKGRVERLYRTLQDRLVAELSFYGVKSRVDANRYLKQSFLPEWDKNFTVEAKSPTSRYRPFESPLGLDYFFCEKFPRKGNRDNTVSFEGKKYRITNREFGSLFRRRIDVHRSQDGSLQFYYDKKQLTAEEIKAPTRRWKKCG